MARTTSSDVAELLGDDYDSATPRSLTAFIATANVIVSRVVTCATSKGITLTTEELELIERWLAAHFYCQSDKNYVSKSTEGASASFSGQTGMYLESTLYGQTALNLDYSGCLTAIGKRQSADAFWLGKTPSEQLDYTARD